MVLSEPYPILGIFLLPLNLLLMRLSMPELDDDFTSGSSPAFSESSTVEIGLEASELKGSLLDNTFFEEGSRFHHNIIYDYYKNIKSIVCIHHNHNFAITVCCSF